MTGSKLNQKTLMGLTCGLIWTVGWFGPQLEEILGITHSEPINAHFFVQFFLKYIFLVDLSFEN